MIDSLIERIESLGAPVVVGLDPVLGMIPDRIKKKNIDEFGAGLKAAAGMLFDFNAEIIDAVCDIVPAVKPQIAMYEQFGPEGVLVYAKTTAYAKEMGLLVIGDVKRGDISSTAAAYAAHIGGVVFDGVSYDPWSVDAVTLNPYLGIDGIKPFVDICLREDKAVFVLVKTSNPSSAELQDMLLVKATSEDSDGNKAGNLGSSEVQGVALAKALNEKPGGMDGGNIGSSGVQGMAPVEAFYENSGGMGGGNLGSSGVQGVASAKARADSVSSSYLTVYEHVADLVSKWGESTIGKSGYSKVAAVVGATFPEQGAALRLRMPHTFFLIPGYGAQGATGADLKGFFDRDGRGCIVNSSRGIIAAWKKDARFDENDVGAAAREAAQVMIADLRYYC